MAREVLAMDLPERTAGPGNRLSWNGYGKANKPFTPGRTPGVDAGPRPASTGPVHAARDESARPKIAMSGRAIGRAASPGLAVRSPPDWLYG